MCHGLQLSVRVSEELRVSTVTRGQATTSFLLTADGCVCGCVHVLIEPEGREEGRGRERRKVRKQVEEGRGRKKKGV